jgi:TolB-like protein/Flp pilus assembly protein TadD
VTEVRDEVAPRAAAVAPVPPRRLMLGVAAAALLAAGAAFLYSSSRMPHIQSIAILPLQAIGAASAPEPLALGLADAIITKLAGLNSLIVRPTASVSRFERGDHDPLAAGRALQVDAVLTGTIQRTPDRVRVAAQLFTVGDGREIWADQFDTTARDLFALEDAISERVAGALRVSLSASDRQTIAKRYTSDAEAHELYITGRSYRLRWNADDAGIARGYFEQAIRKDPNYALAYVGLADAMAVAAHFGATSQTAVRARIRSALDQAIRIDPTLPQAHMALGMNALAYEWDGVRALRELEEAVRLGPNLPETHSHYAAVLLAVGKPDLGEREKAHQLEPPSTLYRIGVGWAHFYAHRFALADAIYKEATAQDPNFAATYWSLGESLEAQGRAAEAIAAFDKSVMLTNRNPRAVSGLGHAYGIAGKRAEAQALAAELETRARAAYVPAYFVGVIYLGMGDRERAFAWLDRAVEERSDWLVFIRVHPMFDAVRQDARYRALEQRIGLWRE